MRQSSQYIYLLALTVLILSSNLIQCQSEKIDSIERAQRSLRNIDYINMCIFRRTRLCYFLRELDHIRSDVRREDRQIPKRKASHFYSNW